jgi:hypothetical protein
MDYIDHSEDPDEKAGIEEIPSECDNLPGIEPWEASSTSFASMMRRWAAEDNEHQLDELFAAGVAANCINPFSNAAFDGHRIRRLTARDERLVAEVVRTWTECDAIDGGAPLSELFD